jgi:hypothetical protein
VRRPCRGPRGPAPTVPYARTARGLGLRDAHGRIPPTTVERRTAAPPSPMQRKPDAVRARARGRTDAPEAGACRAAAPRATTERGSRAAGTADEAKAAGEEAAVPVTAPLDEASPLRSTRRDDLPRPLPENDPRAPRARARRTSTPIEKESQAKLGIFFGPPGDLLHAAVHHLASSRPFIAAFLPPHGTDGVESPPWTSC